MALPRTAFLASLILLSAAADLHAQMRLMRPADLFEFHRVGTIEWSPDRRLGAVEIHRPSRWLDRTIPTADIAVVDAASATLRTVSSSSPEIVGFFRPAWSPDGRRLLFLSVDEDANVRAWLWTVDSAPATLLTDLPLHDGPPVARWIDADHAILMVRDSSRPNEGSLYFRIHRGRNVADRWARAREGTEPVVTVLDSWGEDAGTAEAGVEEPGRRIVSVDVRTGAITTIATGALHQPALSDNGRTLTYWRENPPVPKAPVASFFGPDARGDQVYDRVSRGNEVHRVDLSTIVPGFSPRASPPPPPEDRPTLRVENDPREGTRLLLDRPGRPEVEVWRGNEWVRDLRTGRAEAIEYRSMSGAPLTGWILHPPGHVAGGRIPIVTIVYPGTVYGEQVPRAFDPFTPDFEHPQLFAALGYGVALPSMPASESPLQTDALEELDDGVLPLIDVLVKRGIADPDRMAVLGQSAGGWATLGLIARTDRFRTAISSAGSSNLVSHYGTFYGQYRYGDAGDPRRAQVLRMLQFERGFYGAGAPPWEEPERYRANSPIWRVADVRTPVLLVHGELDFVPVQQAEEFFTALYRQDKRVRLVRYAGEWHTIAARENVLDLWLRLDEWLRETMPPPPR